MGPTVWRPHVVDKGKQVFGITVIVLGSDFNLDSLILTIKVKGLAQGVFPLVEVRNELLDSVIKLEDVFLLLTRTLVSQDNLDSLEQECRFPQAVC